LDRTSATFVRWGRWILPVCLSLHRGSDQEK